MNEVLHSWSNACAAQIVNLYLRGDRRENKAILYQKVHAAVHDTLRLASAEQRERLLIPSSN